MPDLPRGSSAAPVLYQTISVIAGARWVGSTTTCSPLARVKLSAPNCCAAAPEPAVAIARSTAMDAAACRHPGGVPRPLPSFAVRGRVGEAWLLRDCINGPDYATCFRDFRRFPPAHCLWC